MKRRRFLESLAGGAVVGTAGTLGMAVAKPEPQVPLLEGPLLKTPAVLMAPRADGLEVVWAVGRLVRGWVEWRTADGTRGRVAEEAFGFVPQGDRIVRVRVDGLRPGTEYEIRVVVEAGEAPQAREEGPWRKFRTLDPEAAATHFSVWNDTHQWTDTIRGPTMPSAGPAAKRGTTCWSNGGRKWWFPATPTTRR
ncbi:MAG: fibronectin type III domain-containing protein [Akkermansiaceae bacterium]|nr:fibronectin type III domain-containing protein [Akkermansiaceae bacterium]